MAVLQIQEISEENCLRKKKPKPQTPPKQTLSCDSQGFFFLFYLTIFYLKKISEEHYKGSSVRELSGNKHA